MGRLHFSTSFAASFRFSGVSCGEDEHQRRRRVRVSAQASAAAAGGCGAGRAEAGYEIARRSEGAVDLDVLPELAALELLSPVGAIGG